MKKSILLSVMTVLVGLGFTLTASAQMPTCDDLVWNPTMLMTVNLSADRTFEDSTFTQAGRLQDAFKLQIDYEVLRTLVMSPMVGFSYNDYDNSSLTDWRYVAGLQVDYSMNRFLSLGARYGYEYADYGSQGFSDWYRHAVGIYATARF